MSPRRVSLPAADDLFRRTDTGSASPVRAVPTPPAEPAAQGRSSGRVRHDEKVTVYLTAGELLELEQARLTLRSEHGIGVDRGRLIREAVAVVLADLHDHGVDSVLVGRLADR